MCGDVSLDTESCLETFVSPLKSLWQRLWCDFRHSWVGSNWVILSCLAVRKWDFIMLVCGFICFGNTSQKLARKALNYDNWISVFKGQILSLNQCEFWCFKKFLCRLWGRCVPFYSQIAEYCCNEVPCLAFFRLFPLTNPTVALTLWLQLQLKQHRHDGWDQ